MSGYVLTLRQRIPRWFARAGQRWDDGDTVMKIAARIPKHEDLAWAPSVALEWVTRVLCRALRGHIVEDDQCCMPEHRFCMSCKAAMPNLPVQPWVSP